MTELRHVHLLAMGPVWDVAPHPDATPREVPGALREHDIQSFPGGMQPSSWTDVGVLIQDWIEQVQALREFIVPAVAGPARLVPLPALATGLLSANALRVAASRGRLQAAKAADGT